MTDKRKITLAELKAQQGPVFEDMVFGLFRPNKHQIFEAKELSAELIAEFSQSDEAFGASLEYANKLRAIWAARYPDKPGLKRLAAPRVEPLRLPVFEQPPATPPEDKPGMTDHTEPAPPAPPAPSMPAPEASPVPELPPAPPLLKPGQIPPAGAAAPPPPPEMRTHFNLPNCRVGVAYSARISGTDAANAPLIVSDIQIPADLGLLFDPETQLVTGLPARDGEFALALHWRYAGATARNSGLCHLIANPDPKSLWKVVEPAPGQPYARAHLDQQLIKAGGLQLLAASRRGRSHEHSGTYRDDDFFLHHDAASGWSVMLVADGAGSARSSREGARLAVQTAGAHLVAQLQGEFGARVLPLVQAWDKAASQAAGSEFHYAFHTAATAAVQAIEHEAQTAGASCRDFATTLLAVATRREGADTFVASFWMGDGAIAAYGPRGTVKLMGTPDSGEFAGQTRFLDRAAISDAGFGKRVRIGRLAGIEAVILMTDGVSDPFFETDNGLLNGEKWDALWDEVAPHLVGAAPEYAVLDWLHFFRQGHHDDRTIAILW